MSWFFQYQFVEITDQMYPKLKGKCLPIVSYEMDSDETKVLGVLVNLGPGNNVWFKREQFILYKSSNDLIQLNRKRSISLFNKIKNSIWRK